MPCCSLPAWNAQSAAGERRLSVGNNESAAPADLRIIRALSCQIADKSRCGELQAVFMELEPMQGCMTAVAAVAPALDGHDPTKEPTGAIMPLIACSLCQGCRR
jgi:hypothetical protein